MRKIILVVFDGLGDLPYEEFKGKTPLEHAKTPNMDFLAEKGEVGLMYTVGPKITPESDAATMSMFGYTLKEHPGRGFLEAEGAGIRTEPSSILFRGNFCKIRKGRRVVDQRAGRISSRDARTLAKALSFSIGDIRVKVHSTEGYRCVVEFYGRGLYDNVSNTHPYYKKMPNSKISQSVRRTGEPRVKKCKAFDKKSEKLARVVNEFTDEVIRRLKGRKANCIILRSPGNSSAKTERFKKRFGIRMLAITNRVVEKGIASFLGINTASYKIDGRPDRVIKEESEKQLQLLKENWESNDMFYIFNKSPDIASHDGDFRKKAKLIGQLDKYLIGPMIKMFGKDAVVCVTADHSSPCKYKAHSYHPVPVVIYDHVVDKQTSFSERTAKDGKLGVFTGRQLIPKLLRTG